MARAGTPTCPATLEPPMGSILYIKQCPPRGGDTLFASMYAAYDALSDRMKAYLDGLTALHDGESTYRGLYGQLPASPTGRLIIIRAPSIRSCAPHPVTGKQALYVNRGFNPPHRRHPPATRATPCWPISTSTPKIRCSSAASAGAKTPLRSGTNRCAQHRAMWDYWPHTRSGTRVTVKGERPV